MSAGSTLGTVKRIVAILLAIAIVLAAGVVIGQAPAIFGVEETPEASITFEDQTGTGEQVTIDEVALSDGGFVVITDGDDTTLAVSDYLEAGDHEDVAVDAEENVDLLGSLTATVHQDTTGDETYAFETTDGEEDHPYLERGFPVSDTATVTSDDEDELLTDSLAVESIEAPANATTDETITVSAEISNPTDLGIEDAVEFRIDGQLVEQQTVDLESGEAETVSADLDTSGLAAGERTVGVFTEADGALATVDLEFHTDPSVEIVDADTNGVTADVAIPVDGFIAIEDNETDDRLGTSDELEPGEHENVTVEFDESVDEAVELRAVLYDGDPDSPEEATAIEHDDETVETTVALDEEETGNEEDNAAEE